MATQNVISTNPANLKELKSYPQHDHTAVEKRIKSVQKRLLDWRDTTVTERVKVLKAIAKEINHRKQALAELASLEMGKPIMESIAELDKCIATFQWYAQSAKTLLANTIVETNGSKSYITYQPLGVILAIMPWNFPYWQVLRCAAPILLAGNTMILKHASNVTGCALAIEQIFNTATGAKDLLRTLVISGQDAQNLIAHPSISGVTFTGSTAVGKRIASTAGAHLKPHVLELGGSDPYVILEDADIDKAVDICTQARLINTGQSCVAAKRFIVHKKVSKVFTQKMVQRFQDIRFGDPLNTDHHIGPMSRVDLRDELHAQVQKSIELGATCLIGGFIPDLKGAYYPATLLTGVKKGMPAYDEELFGPVGAIIEAPNDEACLKIANDTPYGLGAAVFSKNKSRAESIAQKVLQAGSVFVNAQVRSDPKLPFGGIKESGYGRELSHFGMLAFCNIKTVFVK